MAQVTSSEGLLGLPPHGGVTRVTPHERPLAIARLLGVPVGDYAVQRFLDTSHHEQTDLTLMWRSPGQATSGVPDQVCMVVPGSGLTAMFFVSPDEASGSARAAVRGLIDARVELIRAVAGFLQIGCDPIGPLAPHAQDLGLAQSLLEPDHESLIQSFMNAGFLRLADLAYMKRDLPRRATPEIPSWPSDVEVIPTDRLAPAEADRLLIEAMERSYEDTQDCPELCGMRSPREVLASHRAVGIYDPKLWFVVMLRGKAEGCMLLSITPGQSAELVYLGLGKALRGKGLARSLLTFGIGLLSGRAERTLACAVDTRNAPALTLYRAMRFRSFAMRVAMVRPLHPSTGDEAPVRA